MLGHGAADGRASLLGFTLRTVPSESMIDTGEIIPSNETTRISRSKRKRSADDAFNSSCDKFSSLIDSQRSAQTMKSKTELLNQMSVILKMVKDLAPDQQEHRAVLEEELEDIKAWLRQRL